MGADNFFIKEKSSIRLEGLSKFNIYLIKPQVKYALEGVRVNLKIHIEVIRKKVYRYCDDEKMLKLAIYLYRNKIIW